MRPGMYEGVRTAEQAARHSAAQHRTVPHRTAGHGRTARQGMAPHGACSAELTLRCAAELSLAQMEPGVMTLSNQNKKKEKPGFNVQNKASFRWELSEELCYFMFQAPELAQQSRKDNV